MRRGNHIRQMDKQYYIYIVTNKLDSVLYTGVTSDLDKRMHEHKSKLIEGFTKKYNLDKLVYNEAFDDINDAIEREKQINDTMERLPLFARMIITKGIATSLRSSQ